MITERGGSLVVKPISATITLDENIVVNRMEVTCRVTVGSNTRETRICNFKYPQSPRWNDILEFRFEPGHTMVLTLRDQDTEGPGAEIGSASIQDMSKILDRSIQEHSIDLLKIDRANNHHIKTGKLTFQVEFYPDGELGYQVNFVEGNGGQINSFYHAQSPTHMVLLDSPSQISSPIKPTYGRLQANTFVNPQAGLPQTRFTPEQSFMISRRLDQSQTVTSLQTSSYRPTGGQQIDPNAGYYRPTFVQSLAQSNLSMTSSMIPGQPHATTLIAYPNSIRHGQQYHLSKQPPPSIFSGSTRLPY